jgi:hypothetical protein
MKVSVSVPSLRRSSKGERRFPHQVVAARTVTSPFAAMIPDMQYDLRRMALGLVGIDPDHAASAAWAKQHNLVSSPHHGSHQNNNDDASYRLHVPVHVDQPVYRLGQDIAPLDDAVIHFRCGDLMDSEHPNFAFVRFESYARRPKRHRLVS